METLHTLIGVGSAALAADVPYPGKAIQISHKGQWSTLKKKCFNTQFKKKINHYTKKRGSGEIINQKLTEYSGEEKKKRWEKKTEHVAFIYSPIHNWFDKKGNWNIT